MSENNTNRLDSNGLLYLFQRIKTIFTGMFVAKETGKGLSTNDYTTAEKNKLADIAANSQVNVLEGVQRNGTDLTITNKKVNVEVPVLGVQRNGTDLTPNSTTKKVNVEVPVLGISKNGTALTPNSNKVVDIDIPVIGVQRNGSDLTPSNRKVNVEVPVLGVQRNGTDLTPNSSTKKVNVEVPVLGIQKNGTDLTPDSTTKKVNIAVPLVDNALSSSSTNAIQNGVVKDALDLKAPLASPSFTGNPTVPTQATTDNSTKAASTAFVKNAITSALQGKIDLQFSFLETLPASGVVGTFYFIPATTSVTGVDEWEEYVWDAENETFERVGAANVDLTNYFNTTNLPAITNAEIDTILAT